MAQNFVVRLVGNQMNALIDRAVPVPGPPGPVGPVGPAGPVGPQGPPGAMSPWLDNVDANTFNLSNLGRLSVLPNGGITIGSVVPFANSINITGQFLINGVPLAGAGVPTPATFSVNGTQIGVQSELNLIAGSNALLTGVNNTGQNRVDVTVSATGGVPATRQVIAGAGMTGGGPLSADVTLNANVLSVNGHTGAVVLTPADIAASGGVPAARQILTSTGLTGGGDLSVDRTLSVVADTTVQQHRISLAGSLIGTRRELNFIQGSGVTLSVTDDAGLNRVNIAVTGTGGAPQTPWLSNIEGAAYTLNNVASIGNVGYIGVNTAPNSAYGRIYTYLGSLPVAIGAELRATTSSALTLNFDEFFTSVIRDTALSDWTTSRWRIGRKVDSSAIASIDFGTYQLGFNTQGTQRMVIASNGNVGISTASPTFPLSLGIAITARKLAIYDSGADFFGFGVGAGMLRYDSGAGSDHAFFTMGGTERMRISNSGFVGISTNAPNYLLSLGGALGDRLAIFDAGASSTTTIYGFGIQSYTFQMYGPNAGASRIALGFGNSASLTEVLTVKVNQCVGINYNAPNDALVINGLPGSGQGQFRIVYGGYGAFFRNDGGSFYCMTTASGDPFGTWTPNPPWSVNLASNIMTIYALNLTGSMTSNGPINALSKLTISSNIIDVAFSSAAIEVRETNRVANTQAGNAYAPRIAFHWGSTIACQIGMDATGQIRTFDNPGTGYANFGCAGLTVNGWLNASGAITCASTVAFTNQLFGQGKEVLNTTDGAYVRINQSSQFPNGIWLGSSFLGMGSNKLAIGSVGASGAIELSATAADGATRISFNGNANGACWFNTGGNIGINTGSPSSSLTIQGAPSSLDYANQQFAIGETGNNPQYRMTLSYIVLNGNWTSAIQGWGGGVGSTLAINPRGGNVGLGTDLPRGTLAIKPALASNAVGNAITLVICEPTNTAGYYTAHGMFHDGTNWNHSINAWSGGAAGILVLNGAGGRVRVGSAAAPAFALDVAGEVNATGLRINGTPISTGTGAPAGFTTQNIVTGAAIGTTYTNSTGKTLMVSVTLQLNNGDRIRAMVGPSSPSLIAAELYLNGSVSGYFVMTWMVLNGHSYLVSTQAGAPVIRYWSEWY